jgi:hypothetical protein
MEFNLIIIARISLQAALPIFTFLPINQLKNNIADQLKDRGGCL